MRKWRFRSLASGFEKATPLWLYPELNCSSCVVDAEDQSGAGQLAFYVAHVKRNYPTWWAGDAVPIYWGVYGDNVAEHAPSTPPGRSFLTSYTAPVDARTGEPMNWWRLPVRNMRFPAFAETLGWLPSPFQAFAPLRSIVTGMTHNDALPDETQARGLAEERLITAYVAIVLGGARFEDERLALLRDLMTNDEIETAKQAIGAELLRREPTTRPN